MNNFITHTNSIFQYIISSSTIIMENKSQFIDMPTIIPFINNITKEREKLKALIDIPNEKLIFGCFSNYSLMTNEILTIWFEILLQTQNSVLLLIKYNDEGSVNILEKADKYGLVSRIYFLYPLSKDYEMIYNYCSLVDIYLDTPLGINYDYLIGLYSSYCPILSIPSKHFSTKIVWSLYKSLKLKDLLLYTLNEYKEKAISLANNKNNLKNIRMLLSTLIQKNESGKIDKWVNKLEEKIKIKINNLN